MSVKYSADLALKSAPAWENDRLLWWNDALFEEKKDFVTREYHVNSGGVSLSRIVGTDMKANEGISWRELLEEGHNKASTDPDFCLNPFSHPCLLRFISQDGIDWYISQEGDYRCCKARYYFHMTRRESDYLNNVTLEHIETDDVFFTACQSLHALSPAFAARGWELSISTNRLIVGEEKHSDGSSLLHVYKPVVSVTLQGAREGRSFHLQSALQATELLHRFRSELAHAPWWRRIFKYHPKTGGSS